MLALQEVLTTMYNNVLPDDRPESQRTDGAYNSRATPSASATSDDHASCLV